MKVEEGVRPSIEVRQRAEEEEEGEEEEENARLEDEDYLRLIKEARLKSEEDEGD